MAGFGEVFGKNIDTVRRDVAASEAVSSQKSMDGIAERLSELAKKSETAGLTDQEAEEQGILIVEMEKQARLKANSLDRI